MCDRRLEFFGDAVNTSFISTVSQIGTHTRDFEENNADADPTLFTYQYSGDCCENDLIPSYFPGVVYQITQMLYFNRDTLPQDTVRLSSQPYPKYSFNVEKSTDDVKRVTNSVRL